MTGSVHQTPGLVFIPVVAFFTVAVTIHFNLVIAAIQWFIIRAGGEEEEGGDPQESLQGKH
ncbi:MAG: hypothetical protein D6732_24350 [Methanobacteriota archaeon]|nr:MAG: hypothetical protein D6732_24350 [Euryarchaeota archaeon]